jgi:hypothetical protein
MAAVVHNLYNIRILQQLYIIYIISGRTASLLSVCRSWLVARAAGYLRLIDPPTNQYARKYLQDGGMIGFILGCPGREETELWGLDGTRPGCQPAPSSIGPPPSPFACNLVPLSLNGPAFAWHTLFNKAISFKSLFILVTGHICHIAHYQQL